MTIQLKRGLNLPISGQPIQEIKDGPAVTRVALIGDDYVGMRPTMLVNEGDSVKLGQPLFSDKRNAGIHYTAPGSGVVTAINRGAKRKFESIELLLEGSEEIEFRSHDSVVDLGREEVQSQLVESGLWTAFRTRPYSQIPRLETDPSSIFVTAIDTNPLAAEPELVISEQSENFVTGLQVVNKLTRGKTFVCTRTDSRVPGRQVPDVIFEEFTGPHPAGLPGTHIHFLDPVGPHKTVWHIGYQDVIAIGYLFNFGRLMTDRIVAVGGPVVAKPGLYRSRLGACLDEIVADNLTGTNIRVVSGSILSGRAKAEHTNYLGRYHVQISALMEGNHREFLGWQMPGFDKFSETRVYGGSWLAGKLFALTTSTGGSKRAMVPNGSYERVMPLRMLPTQLLRSLLVKNTEEAQALGCLELDEEDLALCTFVCPGKYDYGSVLRENLTTIEKEG